MRPQKASRHLFRVMLGVGGKEVQDWSGEVAVAGGEVTALGGWHFEGKDQVLGVRAWRCRTHNSLPTGARYPLDPATGQAPVVALQPAPVGIDMEVRGKAPVVALTLGQDELKFAAADVLLGNSKPFLGGSVQVERLPEVTQLRPPAPGASQNAHQDDYPAFWIRYKTGIQYLAWVEYLKEKDRVLLAQRQGFDGNWSGPVEVAGPGDHFRVALAGAHGGSLWVVWSSQRDGRWDLYAREYKDERLGPEVRLTESAGPHVWHQMTTDMRGRVWLVWQGVRDGHFQIFARYADASGWQAPMAISDGTANNWEPAIASDPQADRVWIGWDTYKTGNYQVRVRSVLVGSQMVLGEVLSPENNSRFSAHVSLACDASGRLWSAWNESGAEWGKDAGFLYPDSPATRLYESRRVRVKCYAHGKWLDPPADFDAILPPALKEYNDLPQLQGDSEGRMWLAFRHRTCRRPRVDGWAAVGRWDIYATALVGDRWLSPIELPESAGRNDMRIGPQRDNEGHVYFAYASDNRAWATAGMMPRNLSISVSRLGNAPKPRERGPGPLAWESVRASATPVTKLVHPRETEQVTRVRDYRVRSGGKTYRIFRGDLHRHTDMSIDGMGDGSLMDLYRYALDAAALDYVMVTDHNMGHDNEYSWWRTQKSNDLYTIAGRFMSMYGYERSVPYPNGHRNVIWTRRGYRTLPLPMVKNPAQMAADTGKFYAYLRRTNGICTLHTSATDQGTDWTEHDSSLEPVVEIYQGYHTSYESSQAPKTEDPTTPLVHGPYREDGFVSHALEKGYRLGFQASSDHVSTHVSYACILAEEFSRAGLVDALRRRHCYAATDNIILDIRMAPAAIMGDEVQTSRPRLQVVVIGTGPIERVEILRDGEVAHVQRAGDKAEEARFVWEDAAPPRTAGANYYYVRVTQKDGQMAWSSPIWARVN
jgi:hypothetical protein